MSHMSDAPRTFWQRYRMPIVLGVIAVGFYVFSIVWIVYGQGEIT